jgi:hypothetical protein
MNGKEQAALAVMVHVRKPGTHCSSMVLEHLPVPQKFLEN